MLNSFCSFNIFTPKELEDVQKTGIEDLRFCKLIEWMCNEISALYGLDETVHAPTGPDNMEFFLLELSSLLSELGNNSFLKVISSKQVNKVLKI